MTEELKPCPMCGKKGVVYQARTQPAVWFARCEDDEGCGMELLRECELEPVAVANWNRRASPWVSVEERLPTFAGRFLVQIAIADRDFSIADFAFFSPIYGNWVILDDRYGGGSVTHWMPIPERLLNKKEASDEPPT